MEPSSPSTVTRLLGRLDAGEDGAADALWPLVYDELRAIARGHRRRWHGDDTLNTTALVHEAYLKLSRQDRLGTASRAHFFALASRAMRHLLCNHARDRQRQKRGGGARPVTLDEGAVAVGLSDEQADTLAAIDDALRRLERLDARQCRVAECRFFGGMTVLDTASALGVSPATVKRDWALAQAWLRRELEGVR